MPAFRALKERQKSGIAYYFIGNSTKNVLPLSFPGLSAQTLPPRVEVFGIEVGRF